MSINDIINRIKLDGNILCTRPWTSLEERSLIGDYRNCCFINRDIGIISKDSNKDILDLWHGDAIKEIRELFSKNEFKKVCPSDCSLLIYKTRINPSYTDFFMYDDSEYDSFGSDFRDNRERVLSSILGNTIAPDTFPLRLKLHPSNTCNLHCRMCLQNKSESMQVGNNYFSNLYKLMPYLEELTIFGGEPFACKITKEIIFGEIIKKSPQIHFSTITNGTLLNEAILDQLKALRLGNFSFSLDSCTEKTYESIRRGAKFSRTMHNLERFVANRDNETIRIRDIEANFVIQKNNFHEISQFVQFAHSLKIKSGFSLITGFHELHDCIDQVKDSIEEAVAVANSCGEHETENNLIFLLSELPGYQKKIKKLHFMYTILGRLHNDKMLFLIRRHNKIRSFIKKVLRLS